MHILILMLLLRDFKAWFVFQLSQAILKLSHTKSENLVYIRNSFSSWTFIFILHVTKIRLARRVRNYE